MIERKKVQNLVTKAVAGSKDITEVIDEIVLLSNEKETTKNKSLQDVKNVLIDFNNNKAYLLDNENENNKQVKDKIEEIQNNVIELLKLLK